MTGTGTKAVQFLNENCKFHILEITQDPSNYIFSRVPCWDQLIYKGNEISEDVFTYTAILDESKKTLSITKWVDDSGQIVMPEKLNGYTVAGIEKEVFRNRTTLESITLPAKLTTLGDRVFSGCTSLKKVVMPGTVTSMGTEVFKDTAIESAGPSGSGCDYEFGWTDRIPAYAFNYIQSLTEVTMPDTITEIGEYAFYHCGLQGVLTLPASLTSLERSAFSECRTITSVVIPDSLAEMGEYVFYDCLALQKAQIGENCALTGVPEAAFTNCKVLENIDLSAGITSIGSNAFRGCEAFTQITIPAAVTSIGDSAIRDCVNLETVTFAEGSSLSFIGSSAFENDKKLAAVEIPGNTTRIGDYAFYGCSVLKKVTLPESVNTMGIQIFRNTAIETAGPLGSGCDYEFGWTAAVPDYGFDYITTLTSLTLPDTITSMGRNAVSECWNLPEITLPADLTNLGDQVFNKCESLTSIEIPEGVTVLPNDALRYCTSLTDVTLPDSLTQIGNYAFGHCDALTVLIIP